MANKLEEIRVNHLELVQYPERIGLLEYITKAGETAWDYELQLEEHLRYAEGDRNAALLELYDINYRLFSDQFIIMSKTPASTVWKDTYNVVIARAPATLRRWRAEQQLKWVEAHEDHWDDWRRFTDNLPFLLHVMDAPDELVGPMTWEEVPDEMKDNYKIVDPCHYCGY